MRFKPVLLFCGLAAALPGLSAAEDSPGLQKFREGLAYQNIGKLQEAFVALQQAVTLDPGNAQAQVTLGIVASRLGRDDTARRALEESVKLDPQSVASYYHLALLHEKEGRSSEALAAWKKFLELSQDAAMNNIAQKHITYLQGKPVLLQEQRR